MQDDNLFSRERLAGYDREVLENAAVTEVGCGAAGNNTAQTLSLAGVGEQRFVDHDVVEPHNLTRSPLFRRERLSGQRVRWKAREIAQATLALSYATNLVVRFATTRVEVPGLAALAGSHVVISAVDSMAVKAYLADATRLLGIPLVELGFSGSHGQVSVWPNLSAEEPCWRCAHPGVVHGAFSCTAYARAAAAQGTVPATQTVAAVFGALAAEAAIGVLHDRFDLAGKILQLDIRTGKSRTIEVTADPRCPGVHRRLGDIHALDVDSTETVSAVFDAIADLVNDPVLQLPLPYVLEAPCERCGALVHLGKPAWAIEVPPACRECKVPTVDGPVEGSVVITSLGQKHPLARAKLRRFGFGPGATFEVADGRTGELRAFQLRGGPDEIFTTLTRDQRNGEATADMIPTSATKDVALETETPQ